MARTQGAEAAVEPGQPGPQDAEWTAPRIVQRALPFAPWTDARTRRLPGILPLESGTWLEVDDAYAAQMAERARLIGARPDRVHALYPGAMPAARELLDTVLAELAARPGFEVGPGAVIRPDGVRVALDRDRPLITLGHLCQEDFCLLEAGGEEHVLTGAILCFPASWTLTEKIGHPLIRIHRPVEDYDGDLARRVQRLFDAIRPGRGLWRQNALLYADPTLHHPRREDSPRSRPPTEAARFVRSERQCLQRLPQTGAVVFSIHTYVVAVEDLTAEQTRALAEHPLGRAG